jgi:hypothetical protein
MSTQERKRIPSKKRSPFKPKKTPKTETNDYATPKAFWGALVGTGLSLVTGLLGQEKQKRQQEEAEKQARAMARSSAIQQDKVNLENFNPEGFGVVDYYGAKGGKLASPVYSATGGDLIPISSDSVVAKGNKHGESTIDNTSGIKLSKNGEQKPFVEIEDDEVIKDNTKVYSDRLKTINGDTFADRAEKLARIKKRTEDNINSGNLISKNTAKRTLANIDNEEDTLFMEQEAIKVKKGLTNTGKDLPKAGFGDRIYSPNTNTDVSSSSNAQAKGLLQGAVPYLDNIVSMFLTANTPRIPKPLTQNIPSLQTKINVNPQLTDIDRAVGSSADFIKRNTSDSNSARNAITSVRLRGAEEKGKVNAYKQNTEANLHNRNVQNAQAINASNLAKLDNFNTANFYRSNDIQERISQNFANLSDDFTEKRNYDAAERYSKERLDIARQMYNQGTTRRALLGNESELQYLRDDPKYAEQILRLFEGTQEESELRKLLGLN